MKQLDNDVNLVVCQKSKVYDWLDHFKTYYAYNVFDLTNKKEYEAFFECGSEKVGVINYDIIYRRKELDKLNGFTLMLDESSMIKNETAKRTKYITKMKYDCLILLSGTPTGGKYEELYSQMRMLGWNISKRNFWDKFIIYKMIEMSKGTPKIPMVFGYKNTELLKAYMFYYGCRFKKTDEVIDLPEQRFVTKFIKTPKQYNKFMKDGIAEVDGKTLVGDTGLSKLLYARQICGSYWDEKLKVLSDMLQETEKRVIIFYNFTNEFNKINNLCKKLKKPVSYVNGEGRQLNFYENESNSVTIIQYQAGSLGLNLQKADTIIYFTPTLSSELFEQSKKRIHRIGQNNNCMYYQLVCKDTVEEDIYETLSKRKDYTDALFERVKK